MNMAEISLIVFAGVIIIGAATHKNCGVIALVAAYILGVFCLGMKPADIYAKGWPMGVFFMALSTTFLFAIANVNGTIEVMAKNIAYFAHGSARLLPLVFFVGGAVISGIGAGGLVIAVIAPIALYIAVENKIPVLMMSLVTMGGIMVGGLSPVAINGLVANRLAAEQNIPGYSYIQLWAPYAIAMTLFSLGAYVVMGGFRLPRGENSAAASLTPFDRKQTMTLAAIAVLLIGVIAFGQNLGLLAFACAGVLILFNAADQKKVFAATPWATLILICGMSVLLKVVVTAGGFTYLEDLVKSTMTGKTVKPAFVALGGVMGAVSSGTGVVMPTLIPMAADVAKQPGMGTAIELVTAVVVGTNGVVISPLSTVGALCLAGAPASVDRNKLYNQLLLSAICFSVLCAAAAYFNLF
jgi:Na+/H+ antiporter NhaD/arsenite permease-like protein